MFIFMCVSAYVCVCVCVVLSPFIHARRNKIDDYKYTYLNSCLLFLPVQK